MTLTPTIVLGLGEAGCRMAAAVDERVGEEGDGEYVKILGVDSRPDDPSRTLPDGASSLVLEGEEALWAEERERASYLTSDHELPALGGAARQRPVGRFLVDTPEALERTWRFLERETERFVTELEQTVSGPSASELDVWILN